MSDTFGSQPWSIAKVARGVPLDKRYRTRGYFNRLINTQYTHPTDSRFVVDLSLLCVVGERKKLRYATDNQSFLLELVVSVSAGWLTLWPSEHTYYDRTRVSSLRILAAPHATDWWSDLKYLVADTNELKDDGIYPWTVASPAPPLEVARMMDLARGMDKGMPPGVLLDWLRENVPVAEEWISSPPLPRAAFTSRIDSEASSSVASRSR